ncbi:MAG: flagellar biosynthesis protein FlhB [Campylobacterota bacterium]|nr:flagellar biosynthesis protein FlhB [Campylobacterota bacterium]
MADEEEKTEEPTSKKIEDSKKEGNVPKSAEVSGAAILFFCSLYLLFFATPVYTEIGNMFNFIYSFIGSDMDGKAFYSITSNIATTLIIALFPLFFLVVFLAIIFNVMQFGFIITPIKLSLDKINPISGSKNLFSMKKLLEALKLTAKLIIIFIVMAIIISIVANDILSMMNKDIEASIESMMILTLYFLLTILLIIIIFAIIDFFFTRHYYFKQLKMSKQEIKDEHKQVEGDPLVKGRIRQIQMKMAKQRMMADVPDADVVVTNPTHYSVALKYDEKKSNAPIVIAKGIDFLALKIQDIARECEIPIIEDPALARALYEQVEVEQEIPDLFYKAIAEIFTFVYSMNGKSKK